MQEPFKRQFYGNIYVKLVSLQDSYRSISQTLSQRFYTHIPKDKEEVIQLDNLEDQIGIADRNFLKIEEIKYWCTLALLTEGSLIKDEELMKAILMLEDLQNVAEREMSSPDEFVATWAKDKSLIIEETTQALHRILDHKTQRKLNTGEISIQ